MAATITTGIRVALFTCSFCLKPCLAQPPDISSALNHPKQSDAAQAYYVPTIERLDLDKATSSIQLTPLGETGGTNAQMNANTQILICELGQLHYHLSCSTQALSNTEASNHYED